MQRIEMSPDAFSVLLKAEADLLAQFSIGFIVPPSEGSINTGRLSGSGSLVSIEGKEGVLTAEHVVRSLQKQKAAGIIFSAYPKGVEPQLVFDPHNCRDFSYHPQTDSADGPDLSFLVLPPDTIATLKATNTLLQFVQAASHHAGTPSIA